MSPKTNVGFTTVLPGIVRMPWIVTVASTVGGGGGGGGGAGWTMATLSWHALTTIAAKPATKSRFVTFFIRMSLLFRGRAQRLGTPKRCTAVRG